MRYPEGVPEHDVGVLDAGRAESVDPGGETGGGDPGGLRDVPACGVELVVFVYK